MGTIWFGLIILAMVIFIEWQIMRLTKIYRLCFGNQKPKELELKLQDYSKNVRDSLIQLDRLKNFTANNFKKQQNALQNQAITRYNPFQELSFGQSFSICLLDNNFTGFILTHVKTPTTAELYVKDIENGKPKKELSIEEEATLAKAMSNKEHNG